MTSNNNSANFFMLKSYLATASLVLCLLALWAMPAGAATESPLKPIDTSSPRATLLGFIEFMDKGYDMSVGTFQSYLDSSRLYATPEEMANMRKSFHYQQAAQRALDLSEVPPAMVKETARRVAIQLKEVLDRLDLPAVESIPDAEAMAKSEFKRWTLPNSEIRIRRVESGPRAGEYLFTPETVSRLPEFYNKVRELPHKAGASVGWHDFASYSPAGVALTLYRIVPTRWLLDAPKRQARSTFLDQPLWRWIGIVVILGAGFTVVRLFFCLSRRWASQATLAEHWADLLRPFILVLVTPLVASTLAEILRVSGAVYYVLTLSLWSLFFLALTWGVWVFGGAVATTVSAMEKLQVGSIDSQLIRLMTRLITIIVSIFILVVGADRVGLPAYSVLAGLGVGGLAVALAAQQTLANLLGSLIIMFEKPFAIGHVIKVQGIEGTVESVGFRSTRIRTTYNSVVTIPSSQLVNSTVDNMDLREYRQVNSVLNLTYDTPIAKIEEFIDGIRNILQTYPHTRKDNIQVVLYDLGPHSLDVLLNFFIRVSNRADELTERERILLDILQLAETKGIHFAFPTQTLHIESLPDQSVTGGA